MSHPPHDTGKIISAYQGRLRLYHGLSWFLWIIAAAVLAIALLYKSDVLMIAAAVLMLSKWLVLDVVCQSLFRCPRCGLTIARVGMPWQNLGTLDVLSCPHCQATLSSELVHEQEDLH